ncbi:MAG: hypothetical protein HQK87_01835 [Nitrospinae bacterium]|nr:hypothetical protein [Nitrospinota bacterium]
MSDTRQKGSPSGPASYDGMTRCHGDNFVIESLNFFCRMLEQQGIDGELLDTTLRQFVEKMDREGKGQRMSCNYQEVLTEQERHFDAVRKDYWGRALFMNLDRYFPTDRLEERKILSEPVQGKLPRLILPGLIELVKSNQPQALLSRYDHLFQSKATRYRRKADNLVDMTAFANDGEVRSVAANLLSGVRRMFDIIPEDERQGWLTAKIGVHPAFSAMKRPLTDEEYRHIVDVIFQR